MAGISVGAWLAQYRAEKASEPAPQPPREPQTHDYTSQTAGHAIAFRVNPDGTLRGHLFSQQVVRTGDYLILLGPIASTRYRIIGELEHPVDPGDMYFFTAEFAPRED